VGKHLGAVSGLNPHAISNTRTLTISDHLQIPESKAKTQACFIAWAYSAMPMEGEEMREQLNIDEILSEGGKVYIAKIKLSVVREDTGTKRIEISSPEDVANLDFIQSELISSDREKFICIHLNIKHVVISYEVVSIGSLNSSVVHPRETLKGAILANAAAIILAHNHPSNCVQPSPEDITVTKRLIEAGNILGIQTLDHITVGDGKFFSF